MIHYQLRCAEAHEFDGWFKSSEAFEQQAEHGLISCPHCADTKVSRALMAPAIPRKGRQDVAPAEPRAEAKQEILPPAPASPAAGGVIPDGVRAALRRLREEVEKNCDYVGQDFAEEARRIHNGESEARGIYGESTEEEAEALEEDGILFARIPWVPRSES